ncbi:hypothetical protein BJV82DRAFT_594075 [Fennellomyces sp. T-0311]|nr:hypothetical protein BJV82DRAFT_594075 [Fennellomyces sp. T-0311]
MEERTHLNIFAITNVDSLRGYAHAYYFLKNLEKNVKLRMFCRNRQGLEQLEQMGGELIETNYLSNHEIENALQDVNYLMFLPEHSRERFQQGFTVLTAAREKQVGYVAMFSLLGVDQAKKYTEYPILHTYRNLEQIMCNNFDQERYCIFRTPVLNEIFYRLTPMVEHENTLRMPVKKGTKMAMVDLGDVVEAVYNLSVKDVQQEDNRSFLTRYVFPNTPAKNQTLFEFTPTQVLTVEQLAEQMGQGLEKDQTLQYGEINASDLRRYLESTRDDERFRRGDRENEYLFPIGPFMNDATIDTLMERWQLANQGLVDKVTHDLERALHRPPMTLNEFFRRNRENFRRLQ